MMDYTDHHRTGWGVGVGGGGDKSHIIWEGNVYYIARSPKLWGLLRPPAPQTPVHSLSCLPSLSFSAVREARLELRHKKAPVRSQGAASHHCSSSLAQITYFWFPLDCGDQNYLVLTNSQMQTWWKFDDTPIPMFMTWSFGQKTQGSFGIVKMITAKKVFNADMISLEFLKT